MRRGRGFGESASVKERSQKKKSEKKKKIKMRFVSKILRKKEMGTSIRSRQNECDWKKWKSISEREKVRRKPASSPTIKILISFLLKKTLPNCWKNGTHDRSKREQGEAEIEQKEKK